ncbi:MAG: MFS transporter [Labedaea sp.]
MISESYPLTMRSLAMSATTAVNWAATSLVSVTFLSLVEAVSRPGTFSASTPGSACSPCSCSGVPSRKPGRSLEDIQHALAHR